jgi:hypothetical protein
MSAKMIAWYMSFYMGGQLLSNMCESIWWGADHLTFVNLLSGAYVITGSSGSDFMNMLVVAWTWVVAFFGILSWDYSFLTGDWMILRWLFFFPMTVGFVWGAIQLARGVK